MDILSQVQNYIDKRIIPAVQRTAYGRQLLMLDKSKSGGGLGQIRIDYLKYVATAKPIISYKLMQDIEDTAVLVNNTVYPAKIQAEVLIERDKWEQLQTAGLNAYDVIADDLTKQYALQESSMIVNGWAMNDIAAPDLLGIRNVAGTTVVGLSFATRGNAIKSIGAAIAAAKAKGIYAGAWNFTTGTDVITNLNASIYDSGIMEKDIVMRTLNEGQSTQYAQIFEDPDMPAGEGILTPVATPSNLSYMGYIEAQAPVLNMFYVNNDPVKSPVKITITGAGVPFFTHLTNNKDDAVVKITGI